MTIVTIFYYFFIYFTLGKNEIKNKNKNTPFLLKQLKKLNDVNVRHLHLLQYKKKYQTNEENEVKNINKENYENENEEIEAGFKKYFKEEYKIRKKKDELMKKYENNKIVQKNETVNKHIKIIKKPSNIIEEIEMILNNILNDT